jgi:hypothetical protein
MGAIGPMWVRVGGGMEFVPDHQRHGPADREFPPPGGPWEPLVLNGQLVGWAERAGLRPARQALEIGQRLVEEQREHLLARLGHKLRSSVLALQESARQAAFGRPELLEGVFEQAQEVGRRAAALEAAAIAPKDIARGVVLGAVLNLALPTATSDLPAEAAVLGSEPVLMEAFTRIRDWVSGDSLRVGASPLGSWWRVSFSATGERKPLAVPEVGEPLVRLIVDTQLEGWLDASAEHRPDIYLPAYHSR